MVAEVGNHHTATNPNRAGQLVSNLELLPLLESLLKSQSVVCTAVTTITFKVEPKVEPPEPAPQKQEKTAELHATSFQDVDWQF